MGVEEDLKLAGRPDVLPEKRFTVAEANQTLVLVRRIVSDVTSKYGELMALRDERAELATEPPGARRLQEVSGRVEQVVEALNRLGEELAAVGCVLKDYSRGLVDFPAVHDGRAIWLCWSLEEPEVQHWHEWRAGYGSRQPVGLLSGDSEGSDDAYA